LVQAAEFIIRALIQTIAQRTVTYDLARQIQGAQEVKYSEFGAAIVKNIKILTQ
jgi:isocitrate dehydrogenase